MAARYLFFDAPRLVSARARTVRIRLAASTPATFVIAGQRNAGRPACAHDHGPRLAWPITIEAPVRAPTYLYESRALAAVVPVP